MKKIINYFNTLKKQLILGISIIVLISTLLVAFIFLSQYRLITLSSGEEELTRKAKEIASLGTSFSYPNPSMQERYMKTLRSVGNVDIWIVDKNASIVLRTQGLPINDDSISKNKELVKQSSNQIKISYDYITNSKSKILTVTAPIMEREQVVGFVLLHKDVNTIYNSYQSLMIAAFLSLLIAFILSIILGILYSKHLTKPIEKITEVANEIRKGNYHVKTKIEKRDEIGNLAKTIDQMSNDIDHNITEIKKLESRAKELVANVSHEFKTPLTLIRGYTMNLQEKVIKPSDEIYKKIIDNTKVLEKLVNELLDLNAYQSGKITLDLEELSLKQLINDVVSDLSYIASSKKVELKTSIKKDLIIKADYTKMRQLLTIFIDNAIKYSKDENLVQIKLKDRTIIIEDNGIGMEKSDLEQIFERYYQVNNGNKGYGLGLCIANYIALHHNFKLNIESEKDKGTKITITI